jgi:hypothetical protein
MSCEYVEFLVLGQHGRDELIQYVFERLTDERRIGVHRLVALAIQARNAADEMLPARAGFDHCRADSFRAAIRGR